MISIFKGIKKVSKSNILPKMNFCVNSDVALKKEKVPVYLRPYDAEKYEVPSTKLKVKFI
jgi:hypothetical protein